MKLPGSRNRWLLLASVGLMLAAALSGCLGGSRSENKAGENEAPVAVLETERRTGYTQETFTFDASKSKDDDGQVREYKFDFGDKTPAVIVSGDQMDEKVDHIYAQGGEYTVTLTVTDDGGDDAGALSSTDQVTVGVNHRMDIPPHVTYAQPSGGSQPASDITQFEVKDEADNVEAQVDLRNAVPLASSEIVVRLRDASNKTCDEETKTLTGTSTTGNSTVTLTCPEINDGMWTLEIQPRSGGAQVEGEIRVFYDKGLPAE